MSKAMRIDLVWAAAVLALAAGAAWAGDGFGSARSGAFRLDAREGTRLAGSGVERIVVSGRWEGSAAVAWADGQVLATAEAGEENTVEWTPAGPGLHMLQHVSGGETLEATFTVLGADVVMHAGALPGSETWVADKVHLVTAGVSVPSGVMLTIGSGAVVKFLDGTGLTVESGGSCMADGVVFTHVADDTVGGDTMMDGDAAVPAMGQYEITGSVTDDDETEYRYLPPQTLSSNISSDTQLRGYRTYIVSNGVTVSSGATLTLRPGTILKFAPGGSFTVNGTLDSCGTRAAPIVFTSLKDDEHGGDTNGDREATEPQPGDWRTITVNGGTAHFANSRILYGSGAETTGAINMTGGRVVFDAGEIAHGLYDAVGVESGNFYMTNSVIRDCLLAFRHWANEPIVNCVIYDCGRLTQGGGQTFVNCVFSRIAETWEAFGFPRSTYRHCVFWNEDGSVLTAEGEQDAMQVCGQDGNVWCDPLFVDADNGDFRLASAASPCVDAADTQMAPVTDFFGQGRLNVHCAATGIPDALGVHGDIGIHEYIPSDVSGMYDLAAVSVSADKATVISGGELSASWTVGNAGERAVLEAWHDALSLVSAGTGKAYPLGEPLNSGILDVGTERTHTVTFAVPVMPEGSYRLRLVVNSRRSEVPEGASTGNNAVLSGGEIKVAVRAASTETGASGKVAAGASMAMAFSVPAGSGDLLLRVTAPAGGSAITGRVGLGHLPADAASGTALVFANGEAWVSVPAGTETVWLVLDNGGAAETSYAADFRSGVLSLVAVEPASLPSKGKVTIQISGAGFTDACTVKVGGVVPATVRCVNGSLIAATVDCAKLKAGAKLAVAVSKGNETKTLANAVTVSAAAGEGKFWAKLSVPESVREGRLVQTCAIEYGNSGTADMTSPVLQVAMTGNGTLGYIGGLSGLKTLQFVAAGDMGSAGILRPGEMHRIRFALRAGSSNKISLHSSVGSTYAPKPWTSAAAYLADLSAAATRVGLRGQDATDYEEVFSLAKAVKAGTNCAILCGRITDADGSALPDAILSFTDKASGAILSAVSDTEGRFATGLASTGIYAISCTGVPLADTSTTASVSGGNDTVLALVAADAGTCAVVAVKGGTEGLAAIATLIEDGTAYAGRAVDNGFEFRGLAQGSYRVQIFRGENEVFFGRLYAEAEASMVNGLEYDGSLPGTLALSTDAASASVGAAFLVVSGENGFLRLLAADEVTAKASAVLPAGTYTVFLALAGTDTMASNTVKVVSGATNEVFLAGPGMATPASAKGIRTASARALSETGELKKRMRAAWAKAEELEAVPLNPPTGNRNCIHNRELYKFYAGYRNEYLQKKGEYRKVFLDYEEAEKAYLLKDSSFKLDVLFTVVTPLIGPVAGVALNAWKDVVEMAYTGQLSFNAFKEALKNAGIPVVSQGVEVGEAYGLIRDFAKRQVLQTQFELHKAAMQNHNLPAMELSNQRFEQFLINNDNYAYRECCPMVFPGTPYQPPVEATQPSVPQSCDPNEMKGPDGTETGRYVEAGEGYDYTIYFENLTNATASAAEVRVTQTLSPQLDWTSFRMVEVSYGDTTDTGLEGKANGTSETNLAGTACTVRTEVALDAETGEVSWYLRVLDPDGDEDGWPLDAAAGFLPPNDPETHCGEGHITYRVNVRQDAEEGARVVASASIVFDANAAIETDPAWWNTVGKTRGVSLDLGNGTKTNATVMVGGTWIGQLPVPERVGQAFTGWWTKKTGGTKVAEDALVAEVGMGTLYARWTKTQTAKFNANGGKCGTASKTYTVGKAYGSLPKATKAGAGFAGWADEEGNVVTAASLVTEETPRRLHAQWTTVQTVTFEANGGECDTPCGEFAIGAAYGALPVATRAGWAFNGWWTAKKEGKKVTEMSKVTEAAARTLYAHWTKTQTVAFNGNGGKCKTKTKKVTVGKKYGALPVATLAGHGFTCWAGTPGGLPVVTAADVVTEAVARTVYAQWTTIQTVTFDANGGECGTAGGTFAIGGPYGELPVATRAGQAFTGWFTAKKAGTKVTAASVATEKAERTLYAHWTKTQTAKFSANGGKCSTKSKTYTIGKAYGSLPKATKKGFGHAGWATAAEGGEAVTVTSVVTEETPRTLYAQWTTNQVVTFDANGGECDLGSANFEIGKVYGELPVAARAGYAHTGWYTAKKDGTKVTEASKATEFATRTLYAHWTAKQTAKFNANGGKCSTKSKAYAIGKAYGSLPKATKKGYGYAGWATAAEGGEAVTVASIVTEETPRNLYAQWTTNQVVTFDANGGECKTGSATFEIGKAYGALPVAMRDGYALTGWYTAKKDGTKVTETSKAAEAATRTLYAHWTAKQMVKFNANGGKCSTSSKTYTIGNAYGNLPTPTLKGHTFAGWADAKSDGARVTKEDLVTAEATRTLYAQWEAQVKALSLTAMSVKARDARAAKLHVHVGFTAVAGMTYVLQWTKDLVPGDWNTLAEKTSTEDGEDAFDVAVPDALATGGFFRVEVKD